MTGCELPVGITALALAIAAQVEDVDELSLLAAVFTQLGDTLATIAVQRSFVESREKAKEAGVGASGDSGSSPE